MSTNDSPGAETFLLTVDPGIEDLVVDELHEMQPAARARAEPYGVPGLVRVEAASRDELLGLGTIRHVIEIRAEGRATNLDDVRQILGAVAIDELGEVASFRVSSTRRGEREGISRLELERAAGAVLYRRYGTKVDLEGFELNVRVDLVEDRLFAGIQWTRDSLANRIRRGRALRSSLRSTTAAAMLRLAGAHRGPGRLIDPMCGAAVIPVEAARINPILEVSAADWDAETVETARGTLANHGLDIDVRLADGRSLGREHEAFFDYIVTDPPYGMRQARRTQLTALYRELLVSFGRALREQGKIVVVVLKPRTFLAALERTGLRVAHQRKVETGRITLRIFVLEHEGSRQV